MLAGLPCSETGNEAPGCICMPIFECIDAADVGLIIGLCIDAVGCPLPINIPLLGSKPPLLLNERGVDGARTIDIAAAICGLPMAIPCIMGDAPLAIAIPKSLPIAVEGRGIMPCC
jgi:hypothetical protein